MMTVGYTPAFSGSSLAGPHDIQFLGPKVQLLGGGMSGGTITALLAGVVILGSIGFLASREGRRTSGERYAREVMHRR